MKKRTRLGRSAIRMELCVVRTRHTRCGACAEHCPTGAITMAAPPTSMAPGLAPLPEPRFEEDYCIGCGACETVCPSRPEKAIYVEGRKVQDEAKVRADRPGDRRDVQGSPAASGLTLPAGPEGAAEGVPKPEASSEIGQPAATQGTSADRANPKVQAAPGDFPF